MSNESFSPTHFPRLTKSGYFTVPSLKTLSTFSSEQLSNVNEFTIANQHGKIVFEKPTDLRDLNLDTIVSIEKNDITVYHDDLSKPEVGSGLNKPACITFYNTNSKSSLRVYNQALQKFLPALDAKLIESSNDNNSLTFKVNHFTRYFLPESDSDEEQPNPQDSYQRDKGEGLFSEEEEPQIYIPEFKEPPSRKVREEVEEAEMIVEHPAEEPKRICLNEHFRICFSPNGKFFLPTEKDELIMFKVSKQDNDVADSLELHLQHLEPPKIAKKVRGISDFSFKNKQNLWKRLAKLYIMKMNKEDWPGNAMLWSLVNVLYGDSTINTYEALNSQEYLENWTSTEHSVENISLNHKRGLKYWIKAWNCLFEPLETDDAGEKILSHMARGEIKEAVITATQSKNLFLANLLSQSASGDFKRCVKKQLETWIENKTTDLFPESIYKIYRLLSGELDIAQLVDWKQSLQLVMTYGLPLNSGIQDAFEYFDKHIKEETAECYPHLPINKEKIDLCYYLIELYSRPKDAIENLAYALNPHTIQQHFNLEASWMTMIALYGVYNYTNISDSFWSNRLNSSIDEIFKSLQKISYAFAEELEFNGNWQWGVYVLMFVNNSQKLIKQLIARHAFEIEMHEEFLINDLHIPKAWIDEAKGLAYESTFDYLNSIMHYLNCEDYYRAHNIFMENAAPQCIISFEGEALYEHLYERIILPLQAKSHELASWSFSGELYCKYLHIAQRMEEFYANEAKYSDLVELIIKIKELVSAMKELPISTIKQQAGISIMEKNLGNWHLELNQKLLVLDDHEENLPEKMYLRFIQRGDAIQQAEKFAGLYLKQIASKIR